jgi:hypothetical protein
MKKIAVLFLVVVFAGCKISFNGASIPPDMKTVNVLFFENNAALVVPYLSQQFTEDLKTRIRNQTKLSITQNDAQGVFEGRISDYDVKPVAIQDNNQPTAASSRLSITVNVKYTNNLNPKQSFEESFTRFKDFSATQSLQAIEQAYIKDINAQLTEDIFNRAFAQW